LQIKQIDNDIHRTFSSLPDFRISGKLYNPLKNILIAFALYRPDLGYVQGMNYLAGTALLF
jgi:hypothetical protein